MSLARDVTTVGSATLVSRLLAFVRDMGIAALLGAGVASDAFFAALLIPNFARRLLADGALNAGFAPIWFRIRHAGGEAAAWRFAHQVNGVLVVLLGAIVVLGAIFSTALVGAIAPGFSRGDPRFDLTAQYLALVFPYVALAGLGAVLSGALAAEGRVNPVGMAVVIFNAAMLAMLLAIALLAPPMPSFTGMLLAQAFVLAGVMQFAVLGWAAWKRIKQAGAAPPRPAGEIREFFAAAVPSLVAAGAPQFALIAGTMIASALPNAVSWLTYAARLYELPLGVVSVAIASVLAPRIAANMRSAAAAGAMQSRACEIAFGVSLPAAAGLGLLAAPIVAVLFERGAFGAADTAAVAAALAAICAGLPGHALEKVLGAVAFAHEDTRTPMLTAAAGVAAAVVAALALTPAYGHAGIAAGIALGAWTGAAALGVVLGRRGWLDLDADARKRLPRIVLATMAMAALLLVLPALLGRPESALPPIAVLALTIAAGLAAYLAMLQVLGVARIADLVAAARKRV